MVSCPSHEDIADFHVHCEGDSRGEKGHKGHIIVCFPEDAFCYHLLNAQSNAQKMLVHTDSYIS